MHHPKLPRTHFEHANPILRVDDMSRSVTYYVDVLGFSLEEWSGGDFAAVSRDGATIYLSEGDQGAPGTWVWIGVEDVSALREEYRCTGARISQEPINYPWAFEMRVTDLDGHVLRFGSDPRDDIPLA